MYKRLMYVVIFSLLIPFIANTQTNTPLAFTMIDNVVVKDGIIYPKEKTIPYVYDGYISIDDEKREKILARWKKKQATKFASLPKEPFIINASAYTAAADETGSGNGITASGIRVKENRTLACPPAYPFGVAVTIDGYGTFVCEDRGGAIKNNKFDIYMETKAQAFAFGRRNLIAYVEQ